VTYLQAARALLSVAQSASTSAKLEEAKTKELKEDPSLPAAKRVSTAAAPQPHCMQLLLCLSA